MLMLFGRSFAMLPVSSQVRPKSYWGHVVIEPAPKAIQQLIWEKAVLDCASGGGIEALEVTLKEEIPEVTAVIMKRYDTMFVRVEFGKKWMSFNMNLDSIVKEAQNRGY
jgi:hypothetical protein